nr:hypothetical protein [Tanacetum cinerariifolium]
MIAILEKYEHSVDFQSIVDFVEASYIRYALTINPTIYVSHIQQFWSTARIETTDEGTKILATVDAFCDYHNMIAILEKYEHNQDFHQIVDFVEASHIRYALTFNPTVYVSHIQQFWSTARIKTTKEGTKILPTVDGKLRTVFESSIRRNLKLNDEAGISSLPNAEPFENLTLMGYNISPNQKRTRIAQSSVLPPVADEPASPFGDDSQGKACPTDSGLEADHDRANITKTSTLPSDSTPRVTSLAADEGSMQHKLTELMDLVKLLEDREGGGIAQSIEDAPIKGRSLDEGEAAAVKRSTERANDDTEEMVTVLTSLDATSILTSGVSVSISPVTEIHVAEVPTGSGSIPTASPLGTGVPTGSGMVPTASLIFTTATESTPYTRRKDKENMAKFETPKKKKLQQQIDVQVARELEEKMARDAQRMNEQIARDAEIARIHAEEELHMMIDGLDRNNETVAKSHAGWKAKHLKGMTLEEIKEKFDPVWKQMQDFIPMGSKEEGERFKRKGLTLKQESAKKVKITEEVTEENLKEMMQLIPVEEVYVEALQVKHPIIDWEHLDRKDLNQLWALVKETLNIRPAVNDKEMELWVKLKRLYEPDVEDLLWTHTQNLMHALVEWKLYDTCGVHHVISKDQEMFMLVEKDYPLRKGLGRIVGNKMHKAFPLSVKSSHCQKKFPLLVRKVPPAEEMSLLRRSHCY